ncbi:TssA family type VI secretion system protein [Rodentibacter pneumotropicus]|uniref:TssA family type VI secretion system protein n=1 Tax=Rodentibacter pneumotropicus TaxID=758 RepID=UPI00232B9A43|nr:TssA family type VI secretion system protein [Rodentibacter pneumotropicus]MDC2826601.1 TssA family type VI secretion system protein [Rodentibacter pneumotropicus]
MKYQNILNDINDETPVGIPDEEGEIFSAIDEQVMKFGSLQHDSINWDILINRTEQYLSYTCKDYKVLQYLGYALLQKNFKSSFEDFLLLFSAFNKKYFFIAYPKPSENKMINRFKEKSVGLILERVESATSNNLDERFSSLEGERIVGIIQELISQLAEYISNAEPVLNRLLRFVKDRIDAREKVSINETNLEQYLHNVQVDNIDSLEQNNMVSNTLNFPEVASTDMNNVRQLKQFYFQVADTTCSIDSSSALGYISRRFGLWHGIVQLPEMNSLGNTMMQSVPLEKVIDYREQVVSSPSIALLERIEKTVTTSPYWIEGSYLSAKCCSALNFGGAAEAIKNVTKQFVDKFSMFHFAKFQNGEPFLNDVVLNWLSDEPITNSSTQVPSVNDLINNFDECYSSDGFVAVLKLIDEQLKSAGDIRSRSYLQFEKIRFFLKEGMRTIAINELLELISSSKKCVVEEWDSIFFTRLERLKDKLLKDNE